MKSYSLFLVLCSYVDNKKDHWHPSPMIVFRDMCGLNSVKIAMWPTHKMNHQDMGERYVRRSQLLEEIGKSCRELDIEYRLYPLNINIKSIPSPASSITSDRIPPSWNQQRNVWRLEQICSLVESEKRGFFFFLLLILLFDCFKDLRILHFALWRRNLFLCISCFEWL